MTEPGEGQRFISAIMGLVKNEDYPKLKEILAHFAGRNLYMPTYEFMIGQFRNKQIYSAYQNGTSLQEISILYALSERQIRRILGKWGIKFDNK